MTTAGRTRAGSSWPRILGTEQWRALDPRTVAPQGTWRPNPEETSFAAASPAFKVHGQLTFINIENMCRD